MSCRDNIGGDFDRRKDNVGGDFGRRRCECVFECLLELLEDAGENRRHHCRRDFVSPDGGFDNRRRRRCDCDCVFECLFELLEDALEDDFCRCPR